MNEKEFAMIVLAIRTVYSNFKAIPDKASADIWYEMLKDIPYQQINLALKEYIATNKFPPTIADLRELTSNYNNLPILDYGEAWEEVILAIRKHGYMEVESAYASMSPLTVKCVKRIGWQNICMSENITADRANFRMIYETEQKRQREDNQLPPQIRNQKQTMIDKFTNDLALKMESKELLPFEPEEKETTIGEIGKELRKEWESDYGTKR
jgi:hypothetical protein